MDNLQIAFSVCNFQPMHQNANLRLDPSSPIYFRQTGELLVGFNDSAHSGAIEVHRFSREIATWLKLIDGSRTRAELIESGKALGISISYLNPLLDQLLQNQHVRLIGYPAGSKTNPQIEVRGAGVLPALAFRLLHKAGWQPSWQPNSHNRIRQVEIEMAELDESLLGQRWDAVGVLQQAPAVVLHFAEVLDPEEILLNQITLPVIWHQRRITIGPFMNLSTSHSPSCLNLQQQALDSDWNYMLTQIQHQLRALPLLPDSILHLAASTVYGIVSTLSLGISQDLITGTYELQVPDTVFRIRSNSDLNCFCISSAA